MAKSLIQSLRRFLVLKKPWEITGPCSSPEYRSALPGALEYRPHAPATEPRAAIVPTSDPDTVFDIKYYVRNQRLNRPPVKRTIIRKPEALALMKDNKSFHLSDFPPVYLTKAVVEDENSLGGGYQ